MCERVWYQVIILMINKYNSHNVYERRHPSETWLIQYYKICRLKWEKRRKTEKQFAMNYVCLTIETQSKAFVGNTHNGVATKQTREDCGTSYKRAKWSPSEIVPRHYYNYNTSQALYDVLASHMGERELKLKERVGTEHKRTFIVVAIFFHSLRPTMTPEGHPAEQRKVERNCIVH